MSEGPTRLTVRGGRDRFNWEDVKEDKHMHNYLGHSLNAPVGRWQNGRDLQWFSRDAKGATDGREDEAEKVRQEKERIKKAERDAVNLALGLPPSPELSPKPIEEADDASKIKEIKSERDGRDRHRERHRHERRSRSRSRDRRHHRSGRSRTRSRSRSRTDDRRRRRDRSRSREDRRRSDRRDERRHRADSRDPERRRERDIDSHGKSRDSHRRRYS